MFLESLEPSRAESAMPQSCRRSLTTDYLFLSQNAAVGFAAEACIDVLRAANRLIGEEIYTWSCAFGDLAQGCGPDQTLVLVGGMENPWRSSASSLRGLRAAIRSAARVCVVGSAVFVPLSAGVLGSKKLAVHPNFRAGVAEGAANLEFHDGATCHHKAMSSAISPAAAVRMMVELIGARDGEFLHGALNRYLGLSEPESVNLTGEHWRYTRMAQGDPVIREALEIMLDHLEDTLSVGQIATLLDVSPRKLERGFQDLLQQTPLRVYRDLRLDRARSLLAQTSLSMNEIAFACGFSNVTLMKKWFSRKYGELPDAVRIHAFGGMRLN